MMRTQDVLPHAPEQDSILTMAHIAEQWTARLIAGDIRYDPEHVHSRQVVATHGRHGCFQVRWNGSRKERLHAKAA